MKNLKTKNLKKIKAVLFDLDGTLIDSEPLAARAVGELFKEWGISAHPDDLTYVTGRTWESAFQYLAGKYQFPVSPQEVRRQIAGRYQKLLETDLIEVPGGREAVLSLAKTYPLALVSGSFKQDILWALKKLQILDCFQIVLGAEDYPKSKPEPDGYLKALAFLQVAGAEGIVFEDSTAGIASGRSAGLWVAAVTRTNHTGQKQSEAHCTIPDLAGINLEWIERFEKQFIG